MAFSTPVTRGSAVDTVSDDSIAMNPSAALAVGRFIVVGCVTKNLQTTDGASNNHSTVADSKGNVWTKHDERTKTAGAAGDGTTVSLWSTRVTTQIETTDTITLTTSGAIAEKIITATEVQCAADKQILLAQMGLGPNAIEAAVSSLTSREYFLIGVFGAEGSDQAKTPDADYTERHDLRSRNNAAATTIHVQDRIATLTADTCTSTAWTNTDPYAMLAAFYEAPLPTLLIELLEGATVRASTTVNPVLDALTTTNLVLTTGERDAITDWSNLKLRLTKEHSQVSVTQAYLTAPDGGGPISGIVNATLGALTTTATGVVALAGVTSATLDALTSVGTGTVALTGVANATLDPLTSVATGTQEVATRARPFRLIRSARPYATRRLLSPEVSWGPISALSLSGAVAATLDDLTSAGTGTVALSGAVTATLAPLTGVGTGTVALAGVASATLDALTVSATGTIASGPIAGVTDVTLDALTSASTGTVALAGVASPTLDALTAAATAALALNATVAATLEDLSAVGTGAVAIAGTTNATLDALTGTGTGALALTGQVAAQLDDITVVATGTQLEVVSGVVNATLDDLFGSSTGVVAIAGAVNPTLDALTGSGAGVVALTGVTNATLDGVTGSGTGIVALAGVVNVTLGALTSSGTGALALIGQVATQLDDVTMIATGSVGLTFNRFAFSLSTTRAVSFSLSRTCEFRFTARTTRLIQIG